MSNPTSNQTLRKLNLPETVNKPTNSAASAAGFSAYPAVQLPPVYSYRQSQQVSPSQANSPHYRVQSQLQSQSQSQPQSQSQSSEPLVSMNAHITQPLQPLRQTNDYSKPRLRVSKACDRCRNHKIKCSGTSPCATCTRQKKECTFSNATTAATAGAGAGAGASGVGSGGAAANGAGRYHNNAGYSFYGDCAKRQKTMVNSEPFGLPTVDKSNNHEYILHLENRVQYLEAILSGNSLETFREPRSGEPESEFITETLFSASSKWRFSRRHQNLLIVELCQSMYSNLSEESRQKVTVPRRQYFGWNMSGVNYLNSEELPPIPDFDTDIDKDYLVNYYFKELNPLFAIIHETVFREQIEAYNRLVREELQLKTHDSKTNQTKLFVAILYLIYALAIRFSEFQKPKGPNIAILKLEEKFFKYAYKIVSILSFEWESFELIQSWLLIALYLRVAHRQTSCSHALGQAITITKSMGLGFGDENPQLIVSTAYERLKATRIFWCVFSIDRVFGLQTGRYCGVRDEDFTRPYPTFDFAQETVKDDWLTLPALALIHIARISNFVHTLSNDNPYLIKYQQINAELVKLHEWFNKIGFRNDLLFNKNDDSEISSLVKSQVKLHYYDLVLCIHGKVLFNYIGRKIASHGLKVEMVLDACHGVIDVLDKTNKAGLLYTPWYSVLLLLFNIGVNAITLINGGVYVSQSRDILKSTIKFFTFLRKSPIRNKQNKLVFRERFKMVRECTWALKMANKILTLRLEEDMNALNNIGVDHGSSDVNKQYFSQLGFSDSGAPAIATQGKTKLSDAKANSTQQQQQQRQQQQQEQQEYQQHSNKEGNNSSNNEFYKVLEKQLHRNDEVTREGICYEKGSSSKSIHNNQHIHGVGGPQNEAMEENSGVFERADSNTTPTSSTDQNEPKVVDVYSSTEFDNMLGNIQWFDQWLDFNYDLQSVSPGEK
ncbi:STB4 [Candida oxycetoniae]|uniref:STB4 n=1 Tax=Candida oxycetoniae TaxID=497107 RepID=A0AAI9SZE7_9ASCO|nr:STB4 [Candida oxycetoniae]KAI3405431.2 STB4 [Candida oxycetoniae]